MRRRGLIAGAGALLAAPAIVRAQGTNGVALVIGNSKYKWEASLPNVKRDAPDVAKAFQALGLKTELVQDASKEAMFAAIEKFKEAARGANFAAFYFAGHGASWDKDTYLVPEDADLGNPSAVRSLLPVSALIGAVMGAAHRLLVFDNCRNNPADGWRQKSAVLASRFSSLEQVAGALNLANTLVLYSTAPGHAALDGPAGQNSPFAASFLRQLEESSVALQSLATKLRRELLIATDGRQVLWDQSTYSAPFELRRQINRSSGTPNAPKPSQVIELDKAYTFARENKLPLPDGLIAIRPSDNAPSASMVGSYKYRMKGYGDSGPALLVVLSVSEGRAAEILYSGPQTAITTLGAQWRLLTCPVVGQHIEFFDIEGYYKYEFAWRDRDSGRYDQFYSGPAMGIGYRWNFYGNQFARLDG